MMMLAGAYGTGPVPVDVISREQDISGQYIHVLVSGLRAAGLVRAVRGPGGGYELARPPSAITALDVVGALEGRMVPVECVVDPATCSRAPRCAARDVWCEVGAAVDGVLASLTLEQLAARQRRKLEEAVSYSI
jgi:Rrf2 family protein